MSKDRVFELCDIVREMGFETHRYDGPGRLEKVYENALALWFWKKGIKVEQQHLLKVYDEDGTVLGDYYADLLIEGALIVDLKAVRATVDEHLAQLLGYLRASRVEHGLLVYFGAPVFFIKKYVMSDAVAPAGRGLGRLASFLFLFAFLCVHCGNLLGAEAPPTKPNVLFIAADDLNHWVGYLGRNAQTITPNMDRLAKRGVWFTRSYCAAPVCNPSRAALMSGLRPGATGVYDNGENFAPVIPRTSHSRRSSARPDTLCAARERSTTPASIAKASGTIGCAMPAVAEPRARRTARRRPRCWPASCPSRRSTAAMKTWWTSSSWTTPSRS